MANRDFRNLGRRRSINLDNLGGAQPTPPPRQPYSWWKVGAIIFLVLVLCAVSVGGYYLVTRPDSTAQPTVVAGNQQQTQSQAQQNSGVPTNVPLPTGPKVPVTMGFVYYVGYYEFPLVGLLNNPYYQPVLVPFEFQAEESGPTLTKGNETEQINMLRSGEIDMLATTSEVLARHPGAAIGIAVWDKSHGVDQIWLSNFGRTPDCSGRPLKIINDLGAKYDQNNKMVQGKCTIAVVGDSVSEYNGLTYLKITGMTKDDINFDAKYTTAADAVAAFNNGEADAVACWDPDCKDANNGNSFMLASTKDIHTIYDVILISPQANQYKRPQITEALADLFTVRNMFLADPEGTSELVAKWQFTAPTSPTSWWLGEPDGKTYSTNWWTGVNPGTAYEDMKYWGLGEIAQAKFDQNLVYINSPELWWENLDLERKVLEWGGSQLETPFDPKALTDMSYLQALSSRKDLFAPKGKSFLDNSFSPFPPEEVALSENSRVIAEFACPNVYFQPDARTIPQEMNNPQYAAFVDCVNTLGQIMNEADIQLDIAGSAPNVDPIYGQKYAHCGELTDNDWCYQVAKGRANWAYNELSNIGFDMTRVSVSYSLGERTGDQGVMRSLRFITIKVIGSGA